MAADKEFTGEEFESDVADDEGIELTNLDELGELDDDYADDDEDGDDGDEDGDAQGDKGQESEAEEDGAEETEDEAEDADEEDEEDEEESLDVLLAREKVITEEEIGQLDDEPKEALTAPSSPVGAGEFTCRSCFLVKRRAQLADEDALLCLDCA